MLHRHARDDSALGHEAGSRAVGYERAAFFDELREFSHALHSHAAPNVVALIGRSEVRSQVRLLVGNRIRTSLWNSVDVRLRRATHMRIDNHVVFLAQVSLAQ